MGKTYTKAQKAAYAKKMAKNRKKAPAKKAVRRVQQKTELKDRVVLGTAYDLTTFAGSPTVGPADSHIIVPESLFNVMTQGDLNGQLHGNEYCPKYLNMKIKLNFEHLDPFGGSVSPFTEPQTYYITLTHGWVKINLKQDGQLSATHANSSSGRSQPAFGTSTNPHTEAYSVAKRAIFQANFDRDFLSYEKRSYQDVKVLKRFRVYGDMRKKFVIPDQGLDGAVNTTIAPDKHFTLNWKMTNKKQELAPITGATHNFGNAESWIPFAMITMKHDVGLATNTKLKIEYISHFTYSDM